MALSPYLILSQYRQCSPVVFLWSGELTHVTILPRHEDGESQRTITIDVYRKWMSLFITRDILFFMI